MTDVQDLQTYFREVARKQYTAVPVPPFTAFFHPSDPHPYLNYAIPDLEPSGDLGASLADLRRVFEERSRTPRFEYVDSFAPALGEALLASGFVDQARPVLMSVTRETFREPVAVDGLAIETLTSATELEAVRAFLVLQRLAFGLESPDPVSDADAVFQRGTFQDGRGFVATLHGEAVAGGVLLATLDGVAEVAGVGTLVAHRRRGIGAAVTAAAVRHALVHGATRVVLSAADERAGRVYESVGFSPCGHVRMLVSS